VIVGRGHCATSASTECQSTRVGAVAQPLARARACDCGSPLSKNRLCCAKGKKLHARRFARISISRVDTRNFTFSRYFGKRPRVEREKEAEALGVIETKGVKGARRRRRRRRRRRARARARHRRAHAGRCTSNRVRSVCSTTFAPRLYFSERSARTMSNSNGDYGEGGVRSECRSLVEKTESAE